MITFTELRQPWPMTCPRGKGLCVAVIDYGPEHDLMYVIAMNDTGEMWTYSNPDVRMRPNETLRAGRVPVQQDHTKT